MEDAKSSSSRFLHSRPLCRFFHSRPPILPLLPTTTISTALIFGILAIFSRWIFFLLARWTTATLLIVRAAREARVGAINSTLATLDRTSAAGEADGEADGRRWWIVEGTAAAGKMGEMDLTHFVMCLVWLGWVAWVQVILEFGK